MSVIGTVLKRKLDQQNLPLQDLVKTEVTFHFWITNYGLRRSFFERKICSKCGEVRVKTFYLHPLPLPNHPSKGHWLLSDCTCIKEKRLKERKNIEQLATPMVRPNPLPQGLRKHTFANFDVTKLNKSAYDDCYAYARNFMRIEKGQGLFLTGPARTGKTHLVSAIVNELKDKIDIYFASFPILLEKMRTANIDLEEVLGADLLILDNIGNERETAWTAERLLIIVDDRLSNMKPTIFTSIYSTNELDKRISRSVVDRIIDNNYVIYMDSVLPRIRQPIKNLNWR